MKAINAVVAICMLVIVASHIAEAAVLCEDVDAKLQPCVEHLKSGQGSQAQLPANCCAEVKAVSELAQSTGDRQGVCECMKSLAAKIPGINYDIANKLPNQCGVPKSYTLGPNTDCYKV